MFKSWPVNYHVGSSRSHQLRFCRTVGFRGERWDRQSSQRGAERSSGKAHQAGSCRKGHPVFQRNRSSGPGREGRHQAPAVGAARLGNPPLGTQFITANPNAGLDWPVRLLLTQDESGQVWAVYSDFGWIAQRHGISNRDDQFKMATTVVQSITSTLAAT